VSEGRDLSGRSVPTLTEIVRPRGHPGEGPDLTDAPNLADAIDQADPVDAGPALTAVIVGTAGAVDTVAEAELCRRVLVELHCRLADDLEAHLRLALAPVIAELTTSLLQETQSRVADTLREMIREAVTREMAERQER
jgi:hypothetical protein